ncbi:MAG: flagellar basal body-associated protein FliL [Lachnospiraceae bacterium]|jgi:flagellar basal body-associated protein FliL|nr:flagellar basal body-associated protein FliL [Lachnospiraceae bacterium]MCI8986045.1 flagellar basal body-associated protein FliL [Lachnospiraceae bacterium]MCI9014760.1 flagellar basal body-associated protein FliL [Lachnospiraceae bacterium]MCI9253526.1 flagellar basal body-associated protein FliL [Lachnospiraceae bacterium]
MKKNLISIIILALLIVNIVLTAIMMFSVTGTATKTSALVDNITRALNLELTAKGDAGASAVPISDIATYDIAEMTIELQQDAEGNQHFFVGSITLSMNTKDKDYKTYGGDMESRESLIKSEITDVISSYTVEDARSNQDTIKSEILERIQTLFNSEFVFNVAFSDILIQ